MDKLSLHQQKVYRFGTFEIDVVQRTLKVDAVPIKMGARAFELLLTLVERPGRVVTKDELIDAVWGRTVVGDCNLHVQISTLRKYLGTQIILTIPGRGYAFALPPEAIDHSHGHDGMNGAHGINGSLNAGENGLNGAQPYQHACAPMQPAALFGRADDLLALEQLLSEHRLVTITGPGGIGKTHLGRMLLWNEREHHRDGVAMVDLTTLTAAEDLPGAIATVLRIPLGTAAPLAALAIGMRPLQTLVMIDNAEAMVKDVAKVAQTLLDACPGLHLLITSQTPLKLAIERICRLEPLSVPPARTTAVQALAYDAVVFFQYRVRAIDRHFMVNDANVASIIKICCRLDGIPLAIELVAPRCPALGLTTVELQLDERFHWFPDHSTTPYRHKTLHASMDWSHALLTPAQQMVFRRLGTFSGGFTIGLALQLLVDASTDDATAVDLLADLVDHSLVAMSDAAAPRYRLLETARAYALEQLDQAGEAELAYQRHALALRSLFETAFNDSWRMTESEFVTRYEPELDNLRSALGWSLLHDVETAIALSGASARLWRCLSLHHQALVYADRAAAYVNRNTPLALAARFYEGIALQHGEAASAEGRESARRAVALYIQLGDRRGQYLALSHLAYSYRYIDNDEAIAAYQEIQRLEEPTWPASVRLFGARIEGRSTSEAERIHESRKINSVRLALATTTGSEYEVNSALVNLADLALIAGDADEAVRLNRNLLARLTHRHAASRAIALGNLIEALLAQAMPESIAEARNVAVDFVKTTSQLDYMFGMFAIDALALLATHEERWITAAHLLGYSDTAYVARHRERGPNEAKIYQQVQARLSARFDQNDLNEWHRYGAGMSAQEACKLVLEGIL